MQPWFRFESCLWRNSPSPSKSLLSRNSSSVFSNDQIRRQNHRPRWSIHAQIGLAIHVLAPPGQGSEGWRGQLEGGNSEMHSRFLVVYSPEKHSTSSGCRLSRHRFTAETPSSWDLRAHGIDDHGIMPDSFSQYEESHWMCWVRFVSLTILPRLEHLPYLILSLGCFSS